MSFSNNRQQAFPASEPPSSSAGGHEMRDYYIDSTAPRPTALDGAYLTPYLGLRARLSQTWINRWTVLIILVLIRLMFAIGTTNELIEGARNEALSACMEVEKVASNVVSLPHYMAQGINTLTADGVNKAVTGMHSVLDLMLTGVEQMVIFYIGMLTNTYLCLITFAVGGTLHATIGALEDAQGYADTYMHGIASSLNNDANKVISEINGLVSGINTLTGSNKPAVDFSGELSALNGISFSANFTSDLQKLNGSIPTFAQVKNDTNTILSMPFELVRTQMNQAWGNYSFNTSLLPVPKMDSVSFCSSSDNSTALNEFFDDLKKVAHTMRNVFLGVLLTAAILACLPAAFFEMRRWAKLQLRSTIIQRFAYDPLDSLYMAARPYTSDTGRWVAGRFSNSKSQMLIRWFIAYCTTLPALLLLSIALAGFISCLFQYMLLKAIEKDVPAIAAEIAGAIDQVVGKVNNASAGWAGDANGVLSKAADDINNDLLGWVNSSTTAINNTLNAFVDDTLSILNATFSGTPLNDPIKEVFNCLIGIKVAGIEAGLTWVHDNAKVKVPSLPSDSMTLGDMFGKSSDLGKFLSNPSSVTQNDVSAALVTVGSKLEAGIRQEALLALGVFICYLIVVFCGLGWMIYKLMGSDVVTPGPGADPIAHPYVFPTTTAPKEPPSTSSSSDTRYDAPTGIAEAYNPKSHFSLSPTSPAPAYNRTFADVNSVAPYALNPHPFPNSSSNGEKQQSNGRNSRIPFWRNLNTSNNPFQSRHDDTDHYDEKKNPFI
jgi:hypothetical protein